MYTKTDYEAMERSQRLLAATSSSSYKTCHENLKSRERTYLEDEKKRSENLLSKNPRFLLIGDEDYPEQLYDMPWPPLILYYAGDITLVKRPCVSIVGSRNCTSYGRQITSDLSSSLAKLGVVIVSGGARGVDTLAHTGAMKESGKTICVLGCGLDVVYPYENQKLFKEISEEGLLLSEYPQGFKPQKWTFPMRNRIIAALSEEIIVTEAAQKSGSLHTATFGEELNRVVHSVPHPINSYNGMGNHLLIEMGARILYDKLGFILGYVENHPAVVMERIKDLKLYELNPTDQDMIKILGFSGMNDESIIFIVKRIQKELSGIEQNSENI